MQKMPVANLISLFDGEFFSISPEETFIIGRELPDGAAGIDVNEKIVSRKHASIVFAQGEYMLCDNGSKNGTFLNGQKILPDQQYKLYHEDVIIFSKLKYIFKIQKEEVGQEKIGGFDAEFCTVGSSRKLMILIPNEKVADYQLQMRKNNDIKGLLPISHIDTAEGIKLYYEVDGLIPWQTMITRKETTGKEMIQIFLQVIHVIKSLPRYLLSENNLVLSPDLIYIDPKSREPGLLYLPLARPEAGDHLEKLAGVFAFAMPDRQEIINELKAGDFSLSGLRDLLEQEIEKGNSRQEVIGEACEDLRTKKERKDKKSMKDRKRNKPGIWICQPLVLLLIVAVYLLHMLKPTDFIGFVIVVVTLDIWLVYTMQKPKGETGETHEKGNRSLPKKNLLFRKNEKGHAV